MYKNKVGGTGGRMLWIISMLFLIWGIACAAIAWLVGSNVLSLDSVAVALVITHLVSSFFVAKLVIKIDRLPRIGATMASAVGIMIIASILNFLIGAEGCSGFLPTLLVVGAGCFCASLLKGERKRKRYKKFS